MIKVAIAGLGTVGASLLTLLSNPHYQDKFKVVAVSARDKNKDRGVDLSNIVWEAAPENLLNHDIDILVELMGGASDPALSLCRAALCKSISVVTANKALLAHHGEELQNLAQSHNVHLRYEAAVAGVIPIIKTIENSLHGNKIKACYGILNGTCNYILTQMEQNGLDFQTALKQAQELGYAEADPTFDIDGTDTAHKTAILSALAFGHAPAFSGLSYDGIKQIDDADMRNAARLGYRIKLLGMAQQDESGAVSQAVFPAMVDQSHSLAKISDSFNAVFLKTDKAGDLMLTGRGAGGMPTATAVLSDMMTIAVQATPEKKSEIQKTVQFKPMTDWHGQYYLNFTVTDEAGVLSRITSVMSAHKLSVYSLLQEQQAKTEQKPVPIVIVTHEAKEADIQAALAALAREKFMAAPAKMIRIADL